MAGSELTLRDNCDGGMIGGMADVAKTVGGACDGRREDDWVPGMQGSWEEISEIFGSGMTVHCLDIAVELRIFSQG